jgi:hypothetical protein
MRKNLLFVSFLLSLLLLAPPAFAISYSGSALLGGFSFSGISVDLVSFGQHQAAIAGGLFTMHEPCDGACRFDEWRNQTVTAVVPPVATAISLTDQANTLYSSSSLTGTEFFGSGASAFSITERSASFIANEAGNFTISVPFSLAHNGIPPPGSGFSASVSASLSLFGVSTHAQIDDVSGITSRAGTFTLTRFFGAGESGSFQLATRSIAGLSVPEPDLLWATLLGLVAIALLVKRHVASSNCRLEPPGIRDHRCRFG